MKYTLILLVVVFITAGCVQQQVPGNVHMVDGIEVPCGQSDGMDSVGCANPQSGGHMMMQDGILPGDGFDITSVAQAKSSTIRDVQDGDRISLSADIVKKTINGNTYLMYGYDGQIPGPAYRVSQGSRITVDFTNNIDMETTVHWHGLRHDIAFDGVPGVSQEPIQPGEIFTYELYFPDDGIFWYHPHIREDIQQDGGLAGNILVLPSTAYNPVNREELVIIDDILIERGAIVPYGREDANFAVMGRFGNVMLTNGETTYTLTVDKGDIVRFYFTNVANVRPFNLSIPGATMKLVGGDLGQYEQEEFVESVILSPAQRVFVDVLFPTTGSYPIMHINPHAKYTLGNITVSESMTANNYAESFINDRANDAVIQEIQSFSEYFDKDVDYLLTLDVDMISMGAMMGGMPCHRMPDGSMMGDCEEEPEKIEWEDDMKMRMSGQGVEWIIRDDKGNENMDVALRSAVGEVVKIRFFNDPESMHPMQHPMHLHGQRFLVTHIDGEPVTNKVWTDTVLVPIGSTVDILIDVTNPGEWMLHCHVAEHLEEGMMTSFLVEDSNK